MKVPPHLIGLYKKTARRYNKLISKIHRETVSSYERKTFLHQLKKLFRKLRELEAQLKIAAAAGAVVLVLNSGQVQAQETPSNSLGPFVKQNRMVNPLREPLFTGENPTIALVDFDKDGDVDVVQGEYYNGWYGGRLRYFENQATQGTPMYLEKFDEENPFSEIYAQTSAVAPAFADIDKDGDLDLFLGQNGGNIYYYPDAGGKIEYYRNDAGVFSMQMGAWNETTKEGNPFDGVTLGENVRPVFIDFDKDGDLDCLIGSPYWTGPPTYETRHVHYYRNNGNGTFVASPLTFDNAAGYGTASPALADLDADGDYDLVLGFYGYDRLFYYRQDTPGNFVREDEEWDPSTKTGNPFYDFEVGSNAFPAFVDFNKDGHIDLFVADEDGYNKYSDQIINYYKNAPGSNFTEIVGIENPFDGIHVEEYASPALIDLDGDQELDAVIGNKYDHYEWDYYTGYTYYYSSLATYEKNNQGNFDFNPLGEDEDPFGGQEVNGYFSPQFVDVDDDGDLDMISGNDYGQVVFFRNEEGTFVDETESSPFSNIGMDGASSARLVDLDNDGDLDLVTTVSYGNIRFWENQEGTYQSDVANPFEALDGYLPWNIPIFLSFTDLDHDGDFDVVFNGYINNRERGAIMYFENTGTPEEPDFEFTDDEMFSDADVDGPQSHFIDYDKDGDLDVFVGNRDGTVSYFQNQNEPVETEVSGTTLTYEPAKDQPVAVGAGLTLSDPDEDLIVQAIVSIDDYQPGDLLTFTSQEDITGSFNTETGVLHFRGKAGIEEYESLLRSVSFRINPTAPGRIQLSEAIEEKAVHFAVYDIDFTDPEVAVKTVNVVTPNIIVFNAIAPNSTGDNKFMRITGLPESNKISIYNRWGDKVYEVENYDNTASGNAFRGLNQTGTTLPSGTYYYMIEIPGRKQINGYLTLKQ